MESMILYMQLRVFDSSMILSADSMDANSITEISTMRLSRYFKHNLKSKHIDAVQVHDPTEHAYYDAGLHSSRTRKSPAADGPGRW